MTNTVISYPISAFQNVPIQAQFYQPSRFVIEDIVLGQTTTITTTVDHNYVIGQLVRLLIPPLYGAQQINNQQGYVISIPAADQVVINLSSFSSNAFITNPSTATITGATQANPCVLTASNHFLPGEYVSISGVGGMVELNGVTFRIISCTLTTITIDVDASLYAAYSGGGIATLANTYTTQPQIVAIGDVNFGQINSSGRVSNGTYILGSFINISPQ